MDTENTAQSLIYTRDIAQDPMDADSTVQGSTKVERGSTVLSNPDSSHSFSECPQGPTALCPHSSNDANNLANHRNPLQPHRPGHPNTMGSNTTPLTESNLKEHSHQLSLLLADPNHSTRNSGKERQDMMAAALQSLGHGDLPDWVIEEMAKKA